MKKSSAKQRKSLPNVPRAPEAITFDRLKELLADTKDMIRGEGDEPGVFTSKDMQQKFPDLAPGNIDRLIDRWIADEWIQGGVKVKRKNRHGVIQTVWGYRIITPEGLSA